MSQYKVDFERMSENHSFDDTDTVFAENSKKAAEAIEERYFFEIVCVKAVYKANGFEWEPVPEQEWME